MSLIGPRPELPEIVARYEPWQHARHLVKPGLTGLWQVRERGNGKLMWQSTGPDIEYVERLSLRTDVSILLRTVPALLGRNQGH
jgi:lipopolysaccharide/colanic/teichoic acid biosynthesis glycosyltransferase